MKNEDTFAPLDVARQLLAIESLLGSLDFLPASRNPLKMPKLPAPDIFVQQANEAKFSSSAVIIDEIPVHLTVEEKIARLAELEVEVGKCTGCELCKTRNKVVFGERNPAARLVFVGEAPGADEDAQGRPFVGRAGELLTKMINAMGLRREDVFICNMLKCRPPQNRTPNPQEIQACWSFLVRQLQIIRPEVIVTLGNPATQGLLNTKMGITRLRGEWQALPEIAPGLGGIPVMPTFHPAYVLRNYSVDTRKKVWADLQQVMARLNLKTPKKQ
ncbi:MAG TPA: uracil-DNA glycosylase [Phycisphaerae bacterium]|nr:uracil-DNA glycosylase [Phycisphaerae bacterium]HPS53588.1 uracil-DNA glycosylase [Phycisphaerae bacterium]